MTFALASLALSGFLLIGLLVTTAHPLSSALPDRAAFLTRWSQLHGGLSPGRDRGPTRYWLSGVYRVAGPLARWGWQPNLLTVSALWTFCAVLPPAYAGGRWPLLGAPVVLMSGLLDGLDGGVAALTGRSTAFGYILDSVADRIAEIVGLVALAVLGAPGQLVVAAGAAVGLLEYTRARAAGTGHGYLGTVTPGERPTRLVLTGAGFLVTGLFPRHAELGASLAAGAMLAVCVLSFGLLMVDLNRRLGRSTD